MVASTLPFLFLLPFLGICSSYSSAGGEFKVYEDRVKIQYDLADGAVTRLSVSTNMLGDFFYSGYVGIGLGSRPDMVNATMFVARIQYSSSWWLNRYSARFNGEPRLSDTPNNETLYANVTYMESGCSYSQDFCGVKFEVTFPPSSSSSSSEEPARYIIYAVGEDWEFHKEAGAVSVAPPSPPPPPRAPFLIDAVNAVRANATLRREWCIRGRGDLVETVQNLVSDARKYYGPEGLQRLAAEIGVPPQEFTVRNIIDSVCDDNPWPVRIVIAQWSIVAAAVMGMWVWWVRSTSVAAAGPDDSGQDDGGPDDSDEAQQPCCLVALWKRARLLGERLWERAQPVYSRVQPAVAVALYYYDMATDLLVIVELTRHVKAVSLSAPVIGILIALIAIFIVHICVKVWLWKSTVTKDSDCLRGAFGHAFGHGACYLGMLIVSPVVDIFSCLALCAGDDRHRASFERMELLETLLEAVPSSVLQSTVFAVGTRSSTYMFLEYRTYAISAVSACLRIVLATYSVFSDSIALQQMPHVTIRQVLTMTKPASPSAPPGATGTEAEP